MPKTIAIIPARGGSKRLPGKNLLPLDGTPLLVHSIRYARANSELIDQVYVSTEDAEIRAQAEKQGAVVLDRPLSLAGDLVPTIDVLKHCLSELNQEVEHVVLLQATNPLRPEKLLRQAFVKYMEHGADSLMTVSRNHQKFGRITDNKFVPYNYSLGQRSQDLEPLYFENGLLYISNAKNIRQGTLLGTNHFPLIVDHPYAHVDIDTAEDLAYAEFILNRSHLS